jgi:tripartite-type tricarboxylate transporter receptor subunit TctC
MSGKNRRKFLATVATTGVLGIAGCSGSSGGGNTESTGGGSEDSGNNGGGETTGSSSNSDFPNERIKAIIPFGQGGGTDIYARKVWSKASDIAGVPVQFENITGAGGMRGGAQLYNAEPNGYSVAPMNTPEVTTTLVDQTDFKLSEFRGVASHATTAMVVITNSEKNVENFDDFASRYESGEFKSIGGMSPGSPTHLIALLFKNDFEIPWQNYVPYDGSGPVGQAVASGELPAGIVTETTAQSISDTGNIDVVAALTSDGSAVFPELESHTEYGYPNIDYAGQIGRFFLTAPETPDARVQELGDLVKQAIQSDELQNWSEETGNPLKFIGGPDYVDDLIQQAYDEIPEKVDIEALRG